MQWHRELSVVITLAAVAIATPVIAADDFELAMVIKETTNPYYNATLAGARIAAAEIGGTANNYGPTQSSPQGEIARGRRNPGDPAKVA